MHDKIVFGNRLGRLTIHEIDYWKMIFSKIIKVGIEYEVGMPENYSFEEMRDKLYDVFSPTKSINYVGSGILDIVYDGSINNGIELITVGRRYNWNTFYEMNKKIIDEFIKHDFFSNYRTGIHFHLLASYNSEANELEKSVPEIVMANYYQLHRIFAPELYFMASSGATSYAMTRYILFRQPPFNYSAINRSIKSIQENMDELYGKYQMINMNPSIINKGEVERFHVELRYPDTILSPAYVTALITLEIALLNKAIELSQIGIVALKQEEYVKKRELFNKLANLGTGNRESDTSELTSVDIEELQSMSESMVRWLKPEIVSVYPIAYEVLKKIAFSPASLMRIKGMDWRKIEEHLYAPLIDFDTKDKIIQIIVIQQIVNCANIAEWKNKVKERLLISSTKLNEIIQHIKKERVLTWDAELGSMIFK